MCHSREGGNPFGIAKAAALWIPAFAGMTRGKLFIFVELKCRRIHAVTQSGRRRTILKHVT